MSCFRVSNCVLLACTVSVTKVCLTENRNKCSFIYSQATDEVLRRFTDCWGLQRRNSSASIAEYQSTTTEPCVETENSVCQVENATLPPS
jgi:hypothetical protein